MFERVLEKIYEIFPQRVFVFVGLSAVASFISLLLTHDEVLLAPTISYSLVAMATVLGIELFPNLKYEITNIKFIAIKVGILTLVSLPTAFLIMPSWESACILSLTSAALFFPCLYMRGRPLDLRSLISNAQNLWTHIQNKFFEIVDHIKTTRKSKSDPIPQVATPEPTSHLNSYAYYEGKTILITGADTPYGQLLVEHLLPSFPQKLILLGLNEGPLAQTLAIARALVPTVTVESILIHPRDKDYLHRIFEVNKPSYVFHAGSVQTVSLLESNPAQGAHMNTLFTRKLWDLSRRFGVDVFTLVSDDHAQDLSTIAGTTRRLSEIYCQCGSVAYAASHTKTFIIRSHDPSQTLGILDRLKTAPSQLGVIHSMSSQILPEAIDYGNLNRTFDQLEKLASEYDNASVRSLLQALVAVQAPLKKSA